MAATLIGTAATYQAQPTAVTKTEDGTSKVFRWHGAYSAINTLSGSYAPGGTTDSLTIREVSIEPGEGGLATLTVKADNIIAQGTGSGGGGVGGTDPVYELEWQRVDKDIREHPEFGAGGDYELTAADRREVEQCLSGEIKDPDMTLGTNAMELYQRLLRSQTAYPVFVPVARKTSYSIARPTSGNCGTQSTPPANTGAPAGYTYVKMADKVIKRSSGFERVEEWVGFDEVDALIFPAS